MSSLLKISLITTLFPLQEESVEPTESNETTSDSVVGGGEEGSTPLESPKKEEDPPIVDKDKENETGVR